MKLIRQISIGTDYKNAMYYRVGQDVFGGHTITDILEREDYYEIFIEKDNEIKPWKTFNKHMGVSIEFNLEY